jgi:hypothetical protein
MKGKRWMWLAALGFALAVVAAPGDAAAQEAVVGVKGGINSFDLSWKPDSLATSIGHKTGFVGGLFGGYTFSGAFGVQIEALYSRRSVVDQDDDARLSTSYFEIPLLITAKFPVADTDMRPILFAGPSVSFQSKCEVSGDIGATEATFDCDDEMVNVELKDSDWAIVFGAGVDYPLGDFLFGGEFRYNLGLTNLNDDADTRSFETVKTRMWALLLSLGYRF